ncbi:MAG: DUF3810 domain-containing protein [Eubacteriales bacterium]|nr:DUF3810 domain-containing protein [Eubacteriales bacterium]
MFKILKYFFIALPALTGILILALTRSMPFMAENVFAASVFPVISGALTWFSGLFPFSLTEIGLYALILIILIAVIRMIALKLRPFRFIRRLLFVCSVAFLLYALMHGVNFYRPAVREFMDLPDAGDSLTELYDACVEEAKAASELRASLSENADGRFVLSQGVSATLNDIGSAYDNETMKSLTFLKKGASRAKGVLISPLWSYTGITGMYFPMLGEANVNTNVCESDIPFTAAHELAHTKGIAREDECNFLAYLACISSDNAEYRYSGHLSAYSYLANALYKRSPDLYAKAAQYISPAVGRDLAEQREYYEKYSTGTTAQISDSINDSFIKSQGVSSGSASYSEVTALILSYKKSLK